MECQNKFCVYWSGGYCVLREVHLDIQGCCQDCIYMEIPETDLRKARENTLRSLGKE